MYLNVANNIPIVVGDIVNWQNDGQLEKWIIFKKEKKVNGTYQTFSIVRCNYLMKWIDKNGHLQSSWSYFVSSMESKIKENFRTWNSLITPQPNKYAEMILPKKEIERGTSFIVEDEAWSMVEYDHTSVPGVMYLSLTEEKVNYVYDDLETIKGLFHNFYTERTKKYKSLCSVVVPVENGDSEKASDFIIGIKS